MLKHKMKDRQVQMVMEIDDDVTRIWNELSFEAVQNVLTNWMYRLEWAIWNGGDYFIC
jgi:hypothetical protein